MTTVQPSDLNIGWLFDRIRDAVVVADIDTERIVLWNPAATQLFGYSAADALGMPLEVLVPPAWRARHHAGLDAYRRTGQGPLIEAEAPIEVPAVHQDGSERTVELRLSPIVDRHQRGRFVLAIIRDVTERNEARDALARLAAIVNATDDAIHRMTCEGIITSWNPGAERLYGYTAAEILGQPITVLIPPERHPRVPDVLARLRAGEHITNYETERLCKDGRRVAVSVNLAPLHDATGAVVGVASIARDITARLEVEETLRRRERQLADAQAIARLGSFDWDLAADSLTWSEPLYAIYGVSPETFQPTVENFLQRVHPDDRAATAAAVTEAVRTGQPFAREERIVRPDGTIRLLQTRGGVIVNAQGHPARLVGICQDVTEQRAAEEQALQLMREQTARAMAEATVRARDEFLAAASHDLKNPLTAIRSQTQLLQRLVARDEPPSPAHLARGLARIDATVNRMTALIDTLLDVTRVQLGQALPLDRRPTDLVALARQVVAEQQATTARHRLTVTTAAPTLVGYWDAPRLERVLINLVGNAIKYSPNGGPIDVALALEHGDGHAWATLAVRDQGLGIPAADLPHVFERFQRGSNVTQEIGGTGIGLTGARQIVEQHGGRIEVESEEGVGTTFTVRLPLTVDGEPLPRSDGPGAGRAQGAAAQAGESQRDERA